MVRKSLWVRMFSGVVLKASEPEAATVKWFGGVLGWQWGLGSGQAI